jgi:hypothetical protein
VSAIAAEGDKAAVARGGRDIGDVIALPKRSGKTNLAQEL